VSELKCGGCGRTFDDAMDLGDHEYTCEGWGDRKPWEEQQDRPMNRVIRGLLSLQIAGSAVLAVDRSAYWPLVLLGCLGWFAWEVSEHHKVPHKVPK
jgi:hypothetical protein